MSQPSKTPLLDQVTTPEHLRRLQEGQLRQLGDELRSETIDAVAVTGGHLGAGLGVIELTVALHYVFDTPRDRLVWDVGHQAYPHKILTGRRDRIRTLRQGNGLSGFTKRAESEFDLLGLFQGVGLPFQSDATPELMPNMIWLYRRPILDYWAEHEDTLGEIVTHVLVHEIGHHFGLSDEDMEAIEASVE